MPVVNNLLTISMITREALRILENSLTFTKQISREYDDRFGIAGAKIGTVINIRKPVRYVGRTGPNMIQEYAVETSVPLALTTQRGVDLYFNSQDLTLSIDDFSKRILAPAIANVANMVDFDGLTAVVNNVYNTIGTPGTPPAAALTYLQAGQRLNEEACPVNNRKLVMPPAFVPPIVDTLKGLFQSSERISEQYDTGMMGIGLGYKWLMDQNLQAHTGGPLGGAPQVTGAGQTGATLATSGWTAAAALRLKAGDVFTIAGVYATNPQNHTATASLRQFTVLADTSSDATGAATIPISPPIIPIGGSAVITPSFGASPVTLGAAYATVSASPGAGALITPLFTANQVSQNALAFHPEAFAMGCADLLMPGGVDMASRVSDNQLGLSIRAVRAYEITTDRFPTRLDILYGFATLYAEMACRVAG